MIDSALKVVMELTSVLLHCFLQTCPRSSGTRCSQSQSHLRNVRGRKVALDLLLARHKDIIKAQTLLTLETCNSFQIPTLSWTAKQLVPFREKRERKITLRAGFTMWAVILTIIFSRSWWLLINRPHSILYYSGSKVAKKQSGNFWSREKSV